MENFKLCQEFHNTVIELTIILDKAEEPLHFILNLIVVLGKLAWVIKLKRVQSMTAN